MSLVAGLDFGGSAVKASVADVETGTLLGLAERAMETVQPAPGRAEFDPATWWRAACAAMRDAVERAARPGSEFTAISVTSLRQGYVLLDDHEEIGPGVLNADRRGAPQLERIRDSIGADRLYAVTGHWSAPQLTLPKLLEEQASSPRRWAQAQTILFVHDWALWRLSGQRLSEPSLASAGQMLDVRSRAWASELLEELGIPLAMLPPLADPATIVGELHDAGLGLPLGIPVLVGGGDTQVAAVGAGGLDEGVLSVVAGTTTPLQLSVAEVPADPLHHPWVSTHLVPGRWAVETNAGYTGMSLDWLAAMTDRSVAQLADEAASSPPGAAGISAVVAARSWNEAAWSNRAPNALVGFEPGHGRGDLARAFIEAHAYAIRGNADDLERVIGEPLREVNLLGGAARSTAFAQLVADVTARSIRVSTTDYPAGRAFAWLAARATSSAAQAPASSGDIVEPRESERYEEGYVRYVAAGDAIQAELAGWVA